jgi:hypothetical protein
MIKFAPYRIVINGNDQDDIDYERWHNSEPRDPEKKPKGLDEMELQPRQFSLDNFSPLSKLEDFMYEAAVFQRLSQIKQYRTGQLVLAASLKLTADLYILPPGFRDNVRFMSENHPMLFEICRASGAKGIPENKYMKNSRVLFMPFLTGSCDKNFQEHTNDSTLLHELVHAVRPHSFDNLKFQSTNDQWTDLEEFFAVVVQNIYISERGDKKVRGGHKSDASPLPSTRAASAEFMADKTNYARVKEALKRESLAQHLANLDHIPFNPFAEFERAKHDLRSI